MIIQNYRIVNETYDYPKYWLIEDILEYTPTYLKFRYRLVPWTKAFHP